VAAWKLWWFICKFTRIQLKFQADSTQVDLRNEENSLLGQIVCFLDQAAAAFSNLTNFTSQQQLVYWPDNPHVWILQLIKISSRAKIGEIQIPWHVYYIMRR
jgi:hypothetical protein